MKLLSLLTKRRPVFARVLLLSADSSHTERIKQELLNLGCISYSAASLEAAQKKFTKDACDLTLVDLRLGEREDRLRAWSKRWIPLDFTKPLTRRTKSELKSTAHEIPEFDPSRLTRFSQGGGQPRGLLLGNLTRIFLQELPKLLKAIHEGQSANDYDKISFAAHRLKSDSEALGLTRLSRISEFFEMHPQKATAKITQTLEIQAERGTRALAGLT